MISVATIFSGIGAFEEALIKSRVEHKILFACDNGGIKLPYSIEEIKELFETSMYNDIGLFVNSLYIKTGKINYVKKSYLSNYEIDEKDFYYDVRFLNVERFRNKIDLLVGGSPCQSFSINGKRLGLEDTRGTLFYDFARIVKESQPKVFIYENVPGLLSHDKGRTWETICNVFEDLNYNWNYEILNAKDFGIAQNRKRIFVVGYHKEFIDKKFKFPKGHVLNKNLFDYLEQEFDHKYFLPLKGFEYTTNPINKKRVSINSQITRCQAANQQFNWCGDFVFIDKNQIHQVNNEKAYCGLYNDREGYVRKLTPRECLRLMGFLDDFKIVVPDKEMYHQSGNSIAVNVLEAIISDIVKDLEQL